MLKQAKEQVVQWVLLLLLDKDGFKLKIMTNQNHMEEFMEMHMENQ